MKLLYETESEFNKLSVFEEKEIRYLKIGKGWELHSSYDPENWVLQPATENYWNYFLVLPAMHKVKKVLILGLGAGTTARQYAHFYPSIEIDGVEIDGEIVKIGREGVTDAVGVSATGQTLPQWIEKLEVEVLHKTLLEFEGNITRAAKKLGIGRATIYRKAIKYNLPISR